MAESDWNEVTYIGKRAKAGQLRSKQVTNLFKYLFNRK